MTPEPPRAGPNDYEARLLARFRDGDARALETLFDRYVDRALGLAVRLTDTREDAEEVTQEAFLRAFRFARTLRAETSAAFGPWLFSIVRSVAADHRRQLRLPTLSLSGADAELLPDANPEIDREMVRRSERAALLAALETLPEEWKAVLTLCDLEEIPHAQAAQALGRSVPATKSLLYRARRALRDRFTELWRESP